MSSSQDQLASTWQDSECHSHPEFLTKDRSSIPISGWRADELVIPGRNLCSRWTCLSTEAAEPQRPAQYHNHTAPHRQGSTRAGIPSLSLALWVPFPQRHCRERQGNLWLERLSKGVKGSFLSILNIPSFCKEDLHNEITVFFHSPIAFAEQEHRRFYEMDLIWKVVRNEAHGTAFNLDNNDFFFFPSGFSLYFQTQWICVPLQKHVALKRFKTVLHLGTKGSDLNLVTAGAVLLNILFEIFG